MILDFTAILCVAYHSPHKFRHGHAVYALKNAKDVSALKAVSQNLMHASLSITDGIYGILSEIDVQEKINSLGNLVKISKDDELEEISYLARSILDYIEKRKQ